jgi:hypothetical protein
MTALAIMRKEGSVEYLIHAGHKVRDPDLLSWVPDPSRLSPDRSYIPALYRKFAAAGSKRATIQEYSQKEIVLKGLFIDIVSDISFMSPRLCHGVCHVNRMHIIFTSIYST